jgi:predicted dehydrogenase
LKKILRYGIIGAGFISDLHLNALKQLRGSKVEVVSVAARDQQKVAQFAKKHNIPSFYTDWRKMVAQ